MKLSEKIILASASPRRHEILCTAGIEHEVVTSSADESSVRFVPGEPERYVTEIASLKNDAVCRILTEPAVVISADTVVYLDGLPHPLGKPKDDEDARRMLRLLSGTTHRVITGVAVREFRCRDNGTVVFAESTDVVFRHLEPFEIEEYVRSGEPRDKAGAYAIQERAAPFVERINGDFFNVVGLPICHVTEILLKYRTQDR